MIERITSAPVAYDGFGTETLKLLPWQSQRGRSQYRLVVIQDEVAEWQISRYHSGMYPAFTEEQFQEFGLVEAVK